MSVIRSDVNDIRSTAEKLGVGELYGLFACMASGRSWNAIVSGIDKQRKSQAEEDEIKNDAAKYLVSGFHFVKVELLTQKRVFLVITKNHIEWRFLGKTFFSS